MRPRPAKVNKKRIKDRLDLYYIILYHMYSIYDLVCLWIKVIPKHLVPCPCQTEKRKNWCKWLIIYLNKWLTQTCPVLCKMNAGSLYTTFCWNSSSLLTALALKAAPTGDQVVTFLLQSFKVALCLNALRNSALEAAMTELFYNNEIHFNDY